MTTALLSPGESARKAASAVLQALAKPGTQGAIATAMGVSDSTISRIKNERLDEVLLLISYAGFKLVPREYKCVRPEAYDFLTRTFAIVQAEQPQLIWETQ